MAILSTFTWLSFGLKHKKKKKIPSNITSLNILKTTKIKRSMNVEVTKETKTFKFPLKFGWPMFDDCFFKLNNNEPMNS